LIKFDLVTKEYSDGTRALDGVSFSVAEGEFVFVVGPSGAGKTTLVKLLLREEVPSEGSLFFDEWEIPELSDSAVAELRRQVGVVFQEFKLIPSRTVLENVTLPLEVVGAEDAAERALEVLELVGLSDRANLFPYHLSGGEKERVSFARALVHKPRLLLADEPTGNIDPETTAKILEVLTKVNEAGTTVIVATHDEVVVDRLRRRVVRLEKGKVVKDEKKGKYR